MADHGRRRMGPRDPRSTVLSPAEEAMIVEFRRRTLLPLDDVMGCLRNAIHKLTRSALHRCLRRHGISRLPVSENKAAKRGSFAETRIGFVHIDSCELRLADGKLCMFLAIDSVAKFRVVEFYESAGKVQGAAFLHNVVAALYAGGSAPVESDAPPAWPGNQGAGNAVLARSGLSNSVKANCQKSFIGSQPAERSMQFSTRDLTLDDRRALKWVEAERP